MKSLFLKAKHWQLFILMFGLPMLIQGFGMAQFFELIQEIEMMEQTGDVSPRVIIESILSFVSIMMVVTVLVSSLLFAWMWSVGVGLQDKIPEGLKLEVKLFKASLIFPIVYFLLIGGAMATFISMLPNDIENINPDDFPIPGASIFSLVFLAHIASIVAMIYNMYFTAKTIKTAEFQSAVTFNDFIGEFFMVWFFPIGIWMLQPTINKINNDEYKEENHEIDV